MNEKELQQLYPAICKWLKIEVYQGKEGLYRIDWLTHDNKTSVAKVVTKIDFLHDLNQLGWIIGKLKEDNYEILTFENKEMSQVQIYRKERDILDCDQDTVSYNKSRPLALLEAVMELINKENG